MSITASWLALAVILFRLLLPRAPKWTRVLLWGFVALRLILPFNFESILSLVPSAEVVPPDIVVADTPHTGEIYIYSIPRAVLDMYYSGMRIEDALEAMEGWSRVVSVKAYNNATQMAQGISVVEGDFEYQTVFVCEYYEDSGRIKVTETFLNRENVSYYKDGSK